MRLLTVTVQRLSSAYSTCLGRMRTLCPDAAMTQVEAVQPVQGRHEPADRLHGHNAMPASCRLTEMPVLQEQQLPSLDQEV